MAVPAYLREESKAKFVTTAVRLAAWTLKWCKDERLFTRRERWILTGDTSGLLKSMDKYLDRLMGDIEKEETKA